MNNILLTCILILLVNIGSAHRTVAARKAFTFIQLTDPQMGFISNNSNFDAENELFACAVEYINQTKPAFVVITGDFVNNRTDSLQIRAFKSICSTIDKRIPIHLIPGNHDVGQDVSEETLNFYLKQYQYDHFDFSYEDVSFIGLNSSLIKSNSSREQEQLKWLNKVFKKNASKRKVVFTHYPFFTKDIDEKESYSNIAIEKRKEYFRLFKANNVQAVFAGHYHNNAEGVFEGIQMITTSAVGKQLGKARPGFREITVYPDSITNKYIEIGALSRNPQSFILLGDLHYDRLEDHDMEWLSAKPGDLRQVTKTYVPNTRDNWDDFMGIIISKTKTFHPPVKAIVQLGDLSEGLAGSELLAEQMAGNAIAAISKLKVNAKWILTKGNHDITGPRAKEAFTKVYTPFIRSQANNPSIENASYSYRSGEALFVVLDLWDDKTDPVVFVEKALKESNAKYKFVTMHEPVIPVTERCWHYARKEPERREKLLEILAKNKAIVLCAHLHRYSVVRRDTPHGPVVQIMVNSVVGNRDHQTPTYKWTLEDYGPGLVDKQDFDTASKEQRKQLLEEESGYVSYYKTCDLPGYAILEVSPDKQEEIKLYYYPAFGSTPYDTINISGLFR